MNNGRVIVRRRATRPVSGPPARCAHDESAERRRATRGRAEVSRAAPARADRILVVDDERSIRILCEVNLRLAGLVVDEAVDGETALAAVAKERPDLVLLDVMMPGLDGWAVAERLRADPAKRDIPVVFLTARVDATVRERAADAGGVGYIPKPFDPVTLAPTLAHILERIRRGEREALEAELREAV